VLLVGVSRDISALATKWELRNGLIDVQPVSNAIGAVLYTTKQAALSGEVVLSDTLAPYRERLTDRPRVVLYPPVGEEVRTYWPETALVMRRPCGRAAA
jgi:hypothetical protein